MGRPFAEEDSTPSVPMPWERGGEEATFENEGLEACLLSALHRDPAEAASINPAWFRLPLHADMARGLAALASAGERHVEANALFASIGRKASDKLEGLSLEGKAVATLGDFAKLLRNRAGLMPSTQRLVSDVRANWLRREIKRVAAHSNGGSPSDGLARLWGELEGLRKAPGAPSQVRVWGGEDFLDTLKPPDYLIEGMLQRRFLYAMTGLSSAGKTALAIRLALCVGTGAPFGPHAIAQPGAVIYFAGENPDDFGYRLKVLARAEGLSLANVYVVDAPASLEAVLAAIEAAAPSIGSISAVIVDTSPAVFRWGEQQGEGENDNVAMGLHAGRLRRLAALPGGPTVLALCHPVKAVASPDLLMPRGASSFFNDLDGNLTVWKHDENLTTIDHNKLRGPEFQPLTFRLATTRAPELVDSRGVMLASVAAIWLDLEAERREQERSERDEDDVLLLIDGERSYDTIGSTLGWYGDSGAPLRKKVGGIVKALIDAKLAKMARRGRKVVLTDAGEAEASKLRLEREAREQEQRRYPDA